MNVPPEPRLAGHTPNAAVTGPAAQLVETAAGWARVRVERGPDAPPALPAAVDWSAEALLVVHGRRETGARELRLRRVERAGATLRATVELIAPPGGDPPVDVVLSPWAVFVLPRAAVDGASAVEVTLEAGGAAAPIRVERLR